MRLYLQEIRKILGEFRALNHARYALEFVIAL
jgi:hypothetical protein